MMVEGCAESVLCRRIDFAVGRPEFLGQSLNYFLVGMVDLLASGKEGIFSSDIYLELDKDAALESRLPIEPLRDHVEPLQSRSMVDGRHHAVARYSQRAGILLCWRKN